MSERILTDTARANDNFAVSLLRYFNPVGAHAVSYTHLIGHHLYKSFNLNLEEVDAM